MVPHFIVRNGQYRRRRRRSSLVLLPRAIHQRSMHPVPIIIHPPRSTIHGEPTIIVRGTILPRIPRSKEGKRPVGSEPRREVTFVEEEHDAMGTSVGLEEVADDPVDLLVIHVFGRVGEVLFVVSDVRSVDDHVVGRMVLDELFEILPTVDSPLGFVWIVVVVVVWTVIVIVIIMWIIVVSIATTSPLLPLSTSLEFADISLHFAFQHNRLVHVAHGIPRPVAQIHRFEPVLCFGIVHRRRSITIAALGLFESTQG
mmetsp:Transcript_22474/g.46950  ORF Transcript_22474/g.46950 Transcript_22474/m.46950 type:complete len:256 (+) Transcript_22474:373-1140(+)